MTQEEILALLTPLAAYIASLPTTVPEYPTPVAVKDDADFKALLTRVTQLQVPVRDNINAIKAINVSIQQIQELQEQDYLSQEDIRKQVDSILERLTVIEAKLSEDETPEPTDPPDEEEPTDPEPEEPTDPTDPVDPEEPEEPTEPEEPPIENPDEPPLEEGPDLPPVEEPPVSYIGTAAKVNAFTDTSTWLKGTFRSKPGFSIPFSDVNKLAFAKDAKIELADGQVRRINYAQVVGNNMTLLVDGPQVDAAKVGSPYSIVVTDKDVKEVELPEPEVPPVVEPEPEQPPVVQPETPPSEDRGVMGIALGMGMGKSHVVPGEIRYDFELPVEADIDRAVSYGMRLFRVGSLRERLIMPGGKSELYLGTHTSQFGGQKPRSLPEIRNFCKLAHRKGCKVMLDLFHNYGGFSEGNNAAKDNNPQHKKIGTEGGPSYDLFANDWKAIIQYLKQDPEAWAGVYGLDIMNEWVSLPSDNVFYATQRFLDICAPIMDDKLAIIEGNAYSNTPNFAQHNPRFKDLVDPRGKGFIEMSGHLYSDQDMSGMYTTPDAYKAGQEVGPYGQWASRVKPFLDYCDQYGFKASIGEWQVPGDYPFLLADAERGIKYALERGCNVIVFGMGKGYASNAHHNLEIDRNKPTLEVVKRLAALR